MAKISSIEAYITQLQNKLPDLASSRDLVEMGLFPSEIALSRARQTGNSPEYIKFSAGRIRYPREAVIQFVREKSKNLKGR